MCFKIALELHRIVACADIQWQCIPEFSRGYNQTMAIEWSQIASGGIFCYEIAEVWCAKPFKHLIAHWLGQECLNTVAAELIVTGLHHLSREISDTEFLTGQVVLHAIFIINWQKHHNRRPVGLVVWFSLRVREVPGSTPGQALFNTLLSMNTTSKRIYDGIFDVTIITWNSFPCLL